MSDMTEEARPSRRDRGAEPAPPPALSDEDRARLEVLRVKAPNPAALPPHVRTEDEEAEFAKLSGAQSAEAAVVALPAPPPNPRERLAALQAKSPHPLAVDPAKVRTEGEEIEYRRIAEQCEMADRLAALRRQSKRTPEEDAELARLTAEVGPEYLVV